MQVIVYQGTPGVSATATKPQSLLSGMNLFLKDMGITFRRDPTNHRPRINKLNSVKDQEQKKAGTFFYMDDDDADDDEGTKRGARKTAKFAKKDRPEAGDNKEDAETKDGESVGVSCVSLCAF